MTLKIVHINKRAINLDTEAKVLWETVLKPNWEAKARQRGEKLRGELEGKRGPETRA